MTKVGQKLNFFPNFLLENRLGNATTRAARLDTLAATVDSHLKVQ